MAGDGDDHGGFVFDGEADGADGAGGTRGVSGLPTGVVAGLVVVVAVVVLVGFAIAYPSATGNLFGGGAGDAGDRGANATSSVGTTAAASAVGNTSTATTSSVTERVSHDTATGSRVTASADRPAATGGATTRATTASSSATTTPTATPTATPTPTQPTSPRTTAATTRTPGGNRMSTSGSRSPVVEAFTTTDRSSDGAAVFDVAWNVSDANRDLAGVTVSLVADPDGAARTVYHREFDAGGARSAGNTTFEVMGGNGGTYELRIEATDGSGNSTFELTRVVADGEPDE